MREWAKAYLLRDPDGFNQYLATAEKIGPEGGEKGHEGEGEELKLTETEKKVAKELGVDETKLIETKKEAKKQ